MLFRFHKTAMAVDGAGVESRFELCEFVIGERHVGRAEILEDSLQIL